MVARPSYPGVYIQEKPSGVRTITGVSTSTALFLGRAKQGPIGKPRLCLSYRDFERQFSAESAGSELNRAVQLFFENGGAKCYVVRLAQGAQRASIELCNEGGNATLALTARDAGKEGGSIRAAVDYRGEMPEDRFNLEVFRVEVRNGVQRQTQVERHTNLSMDPNDARYAVAVINNDSALVDATDKAAAPSSSGYSLSGRPLPDDDAAFEALLNGLLNHGTNTGATQFRMRIAGGAFVDVDMASFSGPIASPGAKTNFQNELQALLSSKFPTNNVSVGFKAGPAGAPGAYAMSSQIEISSTDGKVEILPSFNTNRDAAAVLMLGTIYGGIEAGKYDIVRPAANAVVMKLGDINNFAALTQESINTITIDGKGISIGDILETTAAGDTMYKDNLSSVNGNSDGVREKLSLIARAIQFERKNNPHFGWTAEMWGSRLALIPMDQDENHQGTISTAALDYTQSPPMAKGSSTDIGGYFHTNVRYYSLGGTALAFQKNSAPGLDGTAPSIADYETAYQQVEREVDLFNLLILPKDEDHSAATTQSLYGPASRFCQRQRALLLMDAPQWSDVQAAIDPVSGVSGLRRDLVKDHAALFYPSLIVEEQGYPKEIGASGAMAGLMARTDASRGVWKAPAGTAADIRGIRGLKLPLSDAENGVLNQRGINVVRSFPTGIVAWGARTMDGDDSFGSAYKYIPVRRLALFLEESLYRGMQWVVFEPNDEALWAQIRLNVTSFMQDLFRKGAFQGQTPKEAFFVKCDSETTTQIDRDRGIVNVSVGFAPLKPAEFVILSLQQKTNTGN